MTKLRTWIGSDGRREQWNRDMRFGTWNVKYQHKSESLSTVARELARYKLDLVDVQEVR